MSTTKAFLGFLLLLSLSACAVKPKGQFDAALIPPAPDYSNLDHWAAHPKKKDLSDRTPLPDMETINAEAEVDVLYFYPTTYTGSKQYEKHWNADVNNAKTNSKTDKSAILFQASIFNGVGRVYAPRYRQAHLNVFYSKKKLASGKYRAVVVTPSALT